ncbi:MAG TPA: hypothetical protein VL443_14410 [Cyclobacteriaceae bacterium]|jgi:hypothetical protein|nr:hypothetical protein [Cyclobacteriaceae bacterium]
MNNYQKFGLVSAQVLIGLLSGLGGAIVTALIMTLYDEINGNHYGDLSTSIFSFLLGGYIGMQIGIGFSGYKFLKQNGKQRYFVRFFIQSNAGLFLGLLIGYYLILFPSLKISSYLITIFMSFIFFLPMIGAIIGFNLGLIKRLNDSEMKSD